MAPVQPLHTIFLTSESTRSSCFPSSIAHGLIEVDGGFVGNTPSDIQVAEGDHTVVVKKSGFKDWERKLKSSAGSSVHLGAELEKADTP
jgi:PEGA domain